MIGKSKLRRVLVILFFMLNLRAASAQEMSLRAVYNALSGVMAPIWVAQDAGLFTKHGVNVDLKYLAATTAVQGMLGGGEEIGLVGNQGIDAKLEGADLDLRCQRFAGVCFPDLRAPGNQDSWRT